MTDDLKSTAGAADNDIEYDSATVDDEDSMFSDAYETKPPAGESASEKMARIERER